MPALRQIALNGSGGAFVDVLASINASRTEWMEDEAGAVQGVQFKARTDNFVTTNVVTFGSEPIQMPNMHWKSERGALLGLPQQGTSGAFNFRAADKLYSLRSNGVAGTTVRFLEYE